MIVRKFNYFRFFIFMVIVISIIAGIVTFICYNNYRNSLLYKFGLIGYTEDEYNSLSEVFSDSELEVLLGKEYNMDYLEFGKEKYFIFNNLDKYIEYKSKHKKYENSRIVSIINTESDIDWIDDERDADLSLGSHILVNRLYGLKSDYVPDDLVSVSESYAYSGKKISKSILENITNLIDSAKEEGYTFVISEGYRSYSEQETLYNSYVSAYGMSTADSIVARPGHSEYQTGISFDLVPYNKVLESPKSSEEYLWLKENAHLYGFIFRYEEDKQELTRYNSSTWHLRYVGIDEATIMYNENLCYEEYFYYYLMK